MRLLPILPWRSSAPVWLLLASLATGLAAFLLARQYLQDRVLTLEQQVKDRLQTRPVLVASQSLASGQVLTARDLAIRQMPHSYLRSDNLDPGAAERVLGRPLVHALAKGDALTDNDLLSAESQALAGQLPTGMRALTLSVDEVSSQSGLLRAGDLVDLYYTRSSGDSKAHSQLLLQSVPVLATGKRTLKTPQHPSEVPGEFGTMTLQLSPDDAARVLLAQRTGTVTAVLRGAQDLAQQSLNIADSTQLLTGNRTPVRAGRITVPAALQVIAGGGGTVRSIQQLLTDLPAATAQSTSGAIP